jgi:hypothetical protein
MAEYFLEVEWQLSSVGLGGLDGRDKKASLKIPTGAGSLCGTRGWQCQGEAQGIGLRLVASGQHEEQSRPGPVGNRTRAHSSAWR